MDDVHFILRHAMTGAVFVIFTAAGLWFFDPNLLRSVSDLRADWPEATAALAIIGFPIIGITIQGTYYVAFTLGFGRAWFSDPARKLVADAVGRAIADCSDKTSITEKDWKFIRNAPADAFFVWLYHGRATPHMIEWARRRRSYSYLGANWFLASVGGLAAADLLSYLHGHPQHRDALAAAVAAIWAVGALWAGERMRRDADTMEALWAASQIDPAFRHCVCRILPEEVSETAH